MPAAGVVAEAMVALVLAESCLEKFGGDSVARRAATSGYLDGIPRGCAQVTGTSHAAGGRDRRPARRRQDHRRGLLADRLGVPFRDVDADIEAAEGSPIAEIFVDDGEDPFRELERPRSRARSPRSGVVALGGGAVMDPASEARSPDTPSSSSTWRSPTRASGSAATGRPLLRSTPGRVDRC